MIRHFFRTATLLLAIVSLSSCSNFNKLLKNPSWRVRYEAALKYYEAEDYQRALTLFEDLVPVLAGGEEGEKTQFYYAYCHYQLGMNLLSSHYFKKFYDSYRRSDFAEEAYYMYAYSLYADSPPSHLDQSNTNTAIAALQNFVNLYPKSDYAKQSTALIDELRLKLEKKGFDEAELFFKLSHFKAAVIAMDNFRKDFPDSYLKEKAYFMMVKSSFELAENSILDKKKERLEDVLEHYEVFLEKYPESEYLKEAENLFGKTQNRLAAHQKLMERYKKESEKAANR